MKNTTNVFLKGMTSDMHPLTTSQLEYTHALNATTITFNGNEMMLQNDMGNTKIQDAKTGNIMGLREGFIPVGMKEHGGVIYIASVDKDGNGEIGTVPSPVIRFNKGKKFITGEGREDESNYKEFTIEKGFNESELYQLTDEKLSVGEKFAVALDIDDLIVNKTCYIKNGDSYEPTNIKYNLINKFSDNSELITDDDKINPSGLYKINLYSKTQDQVYNISNIIQSPYKYILEGSDTPNSENWFYNTVDGGKPASNIAFDIDTMLAEDQVDPGTTVIDGEEVENPKSFLKYPNIPDGYPCISVAKEGIKSVLLSTNESTEHVHPITLRDGNKYIIEFPELWYETDSAVHVDYFKVRVKDSNGNKVTLKSKNAETSEGTELTFENGIKRFLDGKFKLTSMINSEPGTWYSGMDDYTTHINNLQSTDLYKSQVLFYIDEIENLNQWFTLEVDCYDSNFENEDSNPDPIYTYSLRFNLYLMDVLKEFTLLKVEPERDYPGVEEEWFSLYYNHGSNPNINLSDTHNFTLTSTIDCKNGLITLSDLDKLSKLDKYKNWENDTSYLYTELVINSTISRTITNNPSESNKLLFTYRPSVLNEDNPLQGVINQSNLTSILFEVSYMVQHNTRQMLLSIGSTNLLNSLEQNDLGLLDITTRHHVDNSDLFYTLSDDVYMDISKINDHIYLNIADLKNFENKYQNLENIEYIELINISIAKFEIKFQMIDGDRQPDITRLYRWNPGYFSNNRNTYTIDHSLSYSINIDEFKNKSDYQIIPQFNLYGTDSIDVLYIPYGIMLYPRENRQITEVVPCNLYTNINYLSTNSGYYIGSLMRRFLQTSLAPSKYPIYEIADDASKTVFPSRYIPAGLYYLYVNFVKEPSWTHETIFTFKENNSDKVINIEFPKKGTESYVVAFPTDGTLTQITMGALELYSSMGMYRVNLDLDTTASKDAKIEYDACTTLTSWFNDSTNSENEQGLESRNKYAVPQAVFNYIELDLLVLSTKYNAKFTPVHGYLKNFSTWGWDRNNNSTKIGFDIDGYPIDETDYRTL